jgi:RNA polymerase sigma-70 factor (sigma-E family)
MEFDDYVRARYAELRRLAFLLSGDWAAADDAVQTALIRCERRWTQIGGTQQHAYVRQAVVNTTSTWRRRRRVHQPLSDLTGVATSEHDQDGRLAILSALQRLPVGQRQVLVLRYYEGLTESEIASLLGISAGTVKSRASRALASLRGSDLALMVAEERS